MATMALRAVATALLVVAASVCGASASTLVLYNRCGETVWPGIQSNAGSSRLDPTGFALPAGASRAVPAPSGWSGRVWARTGCVQDAGSGKVACATGDCGSGSLECDGRNAATPATLAEFTLDPAGGNDFYDVSLVDGYNLPVVVEPAGGGGATTTTCAAAGCAADLSERVRRLRQPRVLLQRRLRQPRHLPPHRLLAAVQVRVPQVVQLRLRRPHQHLHLRRRPRLHHHLLPRRATKVRAYNVFSSLPRLRAHRSQCSLTSPESRPRLTVGLD